jgi:hypothetical protein
MMHDSDRRQRIHRAHPHLRRNIVADILEKCRLNRNMPGGLNGVGIGNGHIKVSINQNFPDNAKRLIAECMGNHYAGIPMKYYEEPKPRRATTNQIYALDKQTSLSPLTGNTGGTLAADYLQNRVYDPREHRPKDPNDPTGDTTLTGSDFAIPYALRLKKTLDPSNFPMVREGGEEYEEELGKKSRPDYLRISSINEPWTQEVFQLGLGRLYGPGRSTGCHEIPEVDFACNGCTISAIGRDRNGQKYIISNAHCFKLPGDIVYFEGKPRTVVKTAVNCIPYPSMAKTPKSHLDASMVKVDPDMENRITWNVRGMDAPFEGIEEPVVGLTVALSGARNLTVEQGVITVTNYTATDFPVVGGGFPGEPVRCLTTYVDLFQVPEIGSGGDSGSPVYNPHTRKLVGIFFGKVGKTKEEITSVMSSAKYIETELGVTITPPDRFIDPYAFSQEYVRQHFAGDTATHI